MLIMAKKPDLTNMVTWTQLGIVLSFAVVVLGVAVTVFKMSVDTGLTSVQAEIKNLRDAGVDLKTSLEKRIDKLDDRLARIEFPPFSQSRKWVGLSPPLLSLRVTSSGPHRWGLSTPLIFQFD